MPVESQILAPSQVESCWTNVDRLEGLQDFPVPKEMTEQDILHAKLNMCCS
jgi:N-ethylmaleimide reductase